MGGRGLLSSNIHISASMSGGRGEGGGGRYFFFFFFFAKGTSRLENAFRRFSTYFVESINMKEHVIFFIFFFHIYIYVLIYIFFMVNLRLFTPSQFLFNLYIYIYFSSLSFQRESY